MIKKRCVIEMENGKTMYKTLKFESEKRGLESGKKEKSQQKFLLTLSTY